MFGLTVLMCLVQTWYVLSSGTPLLDRAGDGLNSFPIITVGTVLGAAIGAMVASRHPDNPVGWLFCVGVLGTATGLACEAYGTAVEIYHSPGVGGLLEPIVVVSFVLNAQWALALLAATFLVFPDGTVSSPRWRPVLIAIPVPLVTSAVVLLGYALSHDVSVHELRRDDLSRWLTWPVAAAWLLLAVLMLLSVISLVRRVRRTTGVVAPAALAVGLCDGTARGHGPGPLRAGPVAQPALGLDVLRPPVRRVRGGAHRRRDRGAALPPVRHRRRHQPGRRARAAAGVRDGRLRRARGHPRAAGRRPDRRPVLALGAGHRPGRAGVPAAAAAGGAPGRPGCLRRPGGALRGPLRPRAAARRQPGPGHPAAHRRRGVGVRGGRPVGDRAPPGARRGRPGRRVAGRHGRAHRRGHRRRGPRARRGAAREHRGAAAPRATAAGPGAPAARRPRRPERAGLPQLPADCRAGGPGRRRRRPHR